MKQSIILLLLLTGAGMQRSFATVQRPEGLVYGGKALPLLSTPLEAYLSTQAKRPDFAVAKSSALWRGYVGNWEIRNDFLYLVELRGADNKPVDLTTVFPEQAKHIKASWFSGDLRAGQGGVLSSSYGLASIYEKEFIFTIEKGEVKNVEIIDRIGEARDFQETVRKLEHAHTQFEKDQYALVFAALSRQDARWQVPERLEGFEVFEIPLGSAPGSKDKKRIVRSRHFAVSGYCEYRLLGASADVRPRRNKLRATNRHRVYRVESIFKSAPDVGESSLVAFAGDELIWLMFYRDSHSGWQEATADALNYMDLILEHRKTMNRNE